MEKEEEGRCCDDEHDEVVSVDYPSSEQGEWEDGSSEDDEEDVDRISQQSSP